jgi:hypothetical protein
MGATDSGEPHDFFNPRNNLTSLKFKKAILLINNGIHAGGRWD